MKGKVITIIGVIIMILVGASYFMFEAFVKDSSNVTAQNVVVAKTEIPEDTVIHNAEEAAKYFEIKRISNTNVVDGAIIVDTGDYGDAGLISKLQDQFSINTASTDAINQLIGYKLTRKYVANEQILIGELSTDVTEFDSNERLYAIETSYVNSVAAEINVGDYIDLWLVTIEDEITTSRKLIGPLKIYKLKTSDNVNITDTSTAIPSIVIFKLDEETIEYISTMQNNGTVFFTKYGTSPTQEDIDNALANAHSRDEENATNGEDTKTNSTNSSNVGNTTIDNTTSTTLETVDTNSTNQN